MTPAAAAASGSPETSAESSSAHERGFDDHSHSDANSLLSTGDEASSHSGSGQYDNDHRSPAQIAIAKRQRYLAWSRCAALLLVLVTAAVAGAVTYVLTSREQDEAVQNQAYLLTEEILTTPNIHLDAIANKMTVMSSSMTALAASQEPPVNWPYYTQADFSTLFGKSYLDNSGATFLTWAPHIQGDLARVQWGNYSTAMANGWLPPQDANRISSQIYTINELGRPVMETGPGPFAPVWEMASLTTYDSLKVNYNMLTDETFANSYQQLMDTSMQVMTPIMENVDDLYGITLPLDQRDIPTSLLITPIFEGKDQDDATPVATLIAVVAWDVFFQNILHPEQPKVYVVVEPTDMTLCGGYDDEYLFEIQGETATYLGTNVDQQDLPDDFVATASTMPSPFATDYMSSTDCTYTLTVYLSTEVYDMYDTQNHAPAIWTAIVVVVIILAGVVFFSYDIAVQKRYQKLFNSTAKTNAIVSSLFPAEIRDQLFGTGKKKTTSSNNNNKKNSPNDDDDEEEGFDAAGTPAESTKYRLKNYLAEEDGAMTAAGGAGAASGPSNLVNPGDDEKIREAMAGIDMHETKPIAELFPNTTVMFADIAGFTAWSSVREPSQVFVLLETVYRAFDNIAKRRKVFKVETVGDCYVAVTGLPEPRKDHAVVMAKFARECLEKFNGLSKQLEISLGPDTGDLAMRAGLHSGPVTAGVLRGDKSRFQLFGDTVNTAARVEATGQRNRVHLSTDTANLLKEAGKEHWIKKRADVVTAKGKGELHTFWLVTPGQEHVDEVNTNDPEFAHRAGLKLEEIEATLPPKIQRLVGWNAEILKKLLQQIIAKRNAVTNKRNYDAQLNRLESEINQRKQLMGEVIEVIALPKFDAKSHKNQENPSKVVIPEDVVSELRLYVCSIAAMHRDNYFHNFEHASHVTMSVSKLLSRIIAPSDIMDQEEGGNLASALHDHTFGITSDPLTQFACVLSALIHDTDHLGVSNAQLVKEKHAVAEFHKGKSVAEQNSIVLAWEKLMSPSFTHLRRCIYGTPSELERFRQIVVNNVLATDIFDKELQTIRKNRWEKAFAKSGDNAGAEESAEDAINRKATIVMEHLIQASDVSHTMQHWHIYRKWNERLFAEMIHAHKQGRLPFDPKAGWYAGELGFFDNYIIPLAKKLKECGVFGVSCDEYLNYALENRREWANKGEEVVAQYIEKYCKETSEDEGGDDKEGGK
mmetsp:Transcript_18394/g.32434  ORF Transcript_18394/g.32434 Transcript_18394/m.32434 type:complete len:1211 (-) Transcript_18394:204-3836(-)